MKIVGKVIMTKFQQRRIVWFLTALIVIGPIRFDSVTASGASGIVRQVLTGPDASRLINQRRAANSRVRAGRDWASARRLGNGLPKSSVASQVAVVRWSIGRGKTQTMLAMLTSFLSGDSVSAAGDCPIEVSSLLTVLQPQLQHVGLRRDDPCAGIDEVYEYYDIYQDGSASDAFGVDVGIEITGDYNTYQHLVTDVTGNATVDLETEEFDVDAGSIAVSVVESYIEESSQSQKEWRGMNCTETLDIEAYLRQKIGQAVGGAMLASMASFHACFGALEALGWLAATPIAIKGFLLCVGITNAVLAGIVATSVALDIGSYFWTCNVSMAPRPHSASGAGLVPIDVAGSALLDHWPILRRSSGAEAPMRGTDYGD